MGEAPVEGMTGSAGSASSLLVVMDGAIWMAVVSVGPEAMGTGVVAVAALALPWREMAQAEVISASNSSAVLILGTYRSREAARTLLSYSLCSASSVREAATARAS